MTTLGHFQTRSHPTSASVIAKREKMTAYFKKDIHPLKKLAENSTGPVHLQAFRKIKKQKNSSDSGHQTFYLFDNFKSLAANDQSATKSCQ